jgi:hypothetical protein
MVFHSDGIGTIVAFFLLLSSSSAALVIALAFVLFGRLRQARNIVGAVSACVAGYTAVTVIVSLLTPLAVVNPGQSYCVDIWCISIQNVRKTQIASDVAYKADVRIFSDANTVKTSAKGFSFYVSDERGRRFPVVSDPAAPPLDTELSPGQSLNTSLTFLATADTRQLFLKNDVPAPWLAKLVIGNDRSLLHRPTVLRVQ